MTRACRRRLAWTLLLAGLLLAPPDDATAQSCGDADGSGGVDVVDAANVRRAAVGLPSACTLARCDVDGSGAINPIDAANVGRAAVGLPASLTCAPADITALVTGVCAAPSGVGRTPECASEGSLGVGFAPVPGAGAPATIERVDAVGQPLAFPEQRRALSAPYDLGGGAQGDRSLILAVRDGSGADLPGFFEIPLDAAAEPDEHIGVTFSASAPAGEFVLRVATQSGGVVSAFQEVELAARPVPSDVLTFVETFELEPTFFRGTCCSGPRVAASPDGAHVYFAADGRVHVYRRAVETGRLTFVEATCGSPGCAADSIFVGGVAVTSDGAHVYLTSFTIDDVGPGIGPVVTVFERNAATGALTFVERVRTREQGGQQFAPAILLSPDDVHVYVDDIVLRRAAATGRLTVLSETPCNDATGMVASSDGTNVYCRLTQGRTIATDRNVQTGALTTIQEVPITPPEGLGTGGLAIAPDDGTVYVTFEDSLLLLARDGATGALTVTGEVMNGDDGVDGLASPEAVTASPADGRVFVGSFGRFRRDGSVAAFEANGGGLTFLEAQFDRVGGVVLPQVNTLAVTPDGRDLYALSFGIENTVTSFRLE